MEWSRWAKLNMQYADQCSDLLPIVLPLYILIDKQTKVDYDKFFYNFLSITHYLTKQMGRY
jgi:hypothetical protein